MLFKKLIYLSLISLITVDQLFASEQKKQENNINSWLGVIGSKDIQNIVCQYLDKYDDKYDDYDYHTGVIRKIAKSLDGKLMASLSDDCVINLWNISNYQNLYCTNSIKIEAYSLDISPDNKYLALGCTNEFRIYNIENTENIKLESKTNSCPLAGKITIINFLNNQYIVAVDKDWGIVFFNIDDIKNITYRKIILNTKREVTSDSHYDSIVAIAIANNHKYLASADSDGDIIIWDISDLPWGIYKINKLSSNTTTVLTNLTFSNNNKYLISSSLNILKIWDINDIKNIQCLHQEKLKYKIIDVKCHPDNKYLVTLHANSLLRSFNISNIKQVQSYDLDQRVCHGRYSCAGSSVFSNDGNAIIFVSSTTKINVVTNLASILKTNNALTFNLALILKTNNALDFDRYCKFCNKTEAEVSKLLICTRCRNARYCNATCQRNDWQNHKDNCK